MKLTAIFLFAICLHISATGVSQITLNETNTPAKKVFMKIEEQTGYHFLCRYALLKRAGTVTLRLTNVTLSTALDAVLKNKGLSYTIIEKTVIIKEAEIRVPESMVVTPLPPAIISGKITDVDGKPLDGVSITIKGKATGTTTNASGYYSLEAESDAVLEISAIGYTTQIVPVDKRNIIDIVLAVAENNLDEVVLQAYGTTTKRRTTSAISRLDMENVAPIPVASINDAVAGRIAGVIVVTTNGAPGSKSSVSIRGGGTPLYVIDNVVRSETDFLNLNPNDIEDYSILKDVAATALYGVSGANGVILVTTKRGQAGKISVNYSYNQIFSQPAIWPTKYGSYERLKALNDVNKSEGLNPSTTEEDLEKYRTGSDPYKFPNTDWKEVVMKDYAPDMRHDLSITSGTRQLTYYGGISYYKQGSILRTDNNFNKRFTYRANTTSYFDKVNLKLTTGLDGYEENYTAPFSSQPGLPGDINAGGVYEILSGIQNKRPWELAYNDLGLPSSQPSNNPAAVLDASSGYTKSFSRVFNGHLSLEYKAHFLQGLTFKGSANYNTWNTGRKRWTYLAPVYDLGSSTPIYLSTPSLDVSKADGKYLTLQGYVMYSQKFGLHKIDFTGLYEQQQSLRSSLNGNRKAYQIIFDQLVAGPAADQTNAGAESEEAYASYIGRLTYNYASKYSLEGAVRRDGSDLFPTNGRWGTFYAISGGYVISEENFMQSLKEKQILNFLKIRGSFGVTGDKSGISRYQYLALYSINSSQRVINGVLVQGTSEPSSLPNNNFSWQENHSRNIGFDLSTLNNRLSISGDYFYTRITGFVVSNPRFATPLGIGLPPINFDSAANRRAGVDFNITWSNKTGDLNYKIGVNFTHFETLTERSASESPAALRNPYTRSSGQKGGFLTTGYYNGGFYGANDDLMSGARIIGSTNVAAGDLKYMDVNGDGQITGDDTRRIGSSSTPRANYGVTIDLGYKGFYFSGVVQGSSPRDRYMPADIQGIGSFGNFMYDFQEDYWRPDNMDALYPRAVSATSVNNGNNYVTSDFWLIRSGFVRLKYLQLGYDFKQKVLKQLGFLSQLKAFVSGTNLISLSKSQDFFIDPESDPSNYNYPIQRTLSFGITAGF